MATRRHERSRARTQALQLLYGCEIRKVAPTTLNDDEYFIDDVPVGAYGRELVCGVAEHKDELDRFLSSTSDHWRIHRMPIVDRCILRLAAYEMIHCEDVPISVSINEAVELARTFGGEDESPRFVNGVLGRIAAELEPQNDEDVPRPEDADAPAAEPEDEDVPESSSEETEGRSGDE